ncbi:MAG: DNA/RNA non-specific endonuclease [Ornithinibacter sp.]
MTGEGYDPDFLDAEIAPPVEPVPGSRLDYTHFSLSLNGDRRLAWWVAWHIDGDSLLPGDAISRSGIRFRADPRVPVTEQTLDAVYSDNRLDRGHVARRADLLWGPLEEARTANSDSFFFTNITPQMDDFNQERLGGSWGLLEAAILSESGLVPRRLTLFGGPVLSPDDPPYRDLVLVPREHWKVVVYRMDGELRFRCFLLTQQIDPDPRAAVGYLDDFDTYAVSIADLEDRTGLAFPGLRGGMSALDVHRRHEPVLVRDAGDLAW